MTEYKRPVLRSDLDDELSDNTIDRSEFTWRQYAAANPRKQAITLGDQQQSRVYKTVSQSDFATPAPLHESYNTAPEKLGRGQDEIRKDEEITSWPGAREELDWAQDTTRNPEETGPYEDLEWLQGLAENNEGRTPWAGPHEEPGWVLITPEQDETTARIGPDQDFDAVEMAELELTEPNEPVTLSQTYPDPNWSSRLLKTKEDQPYNVLGNLVRTFQFNPVWHGVFKYDSFSDTVLLAKSVPQLPDFAVNKPIGDREAALVTTALLDDGFRCGSKLVMEAIATVARDHSFHPVKDYLESLQHDGVPRLETLLPMYCTATDSLYTRTVFLHWAISAVARIYQPGCKADCCLILEGPQGARKSTMLKILGGEWFSDGITDIGTKEALIKMRGKWILELSELAALNRREASVIKAFMSTAVDQYRPLYGRSALDYPRQCVYAGTVNHDVYFNDETGQRRFWPVEVGMINTDWLQTDRDQIWAEAVTLYKTGHPWHLDTPELIAEAEKHQRAKLDTDIWQDSIEKYCLGKNIVSVSDILENCIRKPLPQQTQIDKKRVAHCLQVAGYEKFRSSTPNGVRPWLYRRVKF